MIFQGGNNIPAIVCARCGEITVSRETTEAVRRLVHGGGKPEGVVLSREKGGESR
jgi:hypothetical protein